jgi:DDE superfamily endonuclease
VVLLETRHVKAALSAVVVKTDRKDAPGIAQPYEWAGSGRCMQNRRARRRSEPSKKKPSDAVAIISYDEKPGVQAVATTAPDLPPEPGVHAAFARDHEYKRLGTVSLLAGMDLVTGQVHALVKDRHRSREFVEFLQLLDAAYPARTAIKLILDNHSAHISKETKAWLAQQPPGRFEFTFTPKHGSWLNLV